MSALRRCLLDMQTSCHRGLPYSVFCYQATMNFQNEISGKINNKILLMKSTASQQYQTENMAAANTRLKTSQLNHCLPQICKALLTASCLSCPNDPIQFLKNVLVASQGHDNLQTVDWGWKRFILQRKEEAIELIRKMDLAKTHFERKCQRAAFTKWLDWVNSHKRRKAAAIVRLHTLVNPCRLQHIVAAWRIVAKDSKRTKEYFKRLELSVTKFNSKDQQTPQQTGERVDGVSVLPLHLSLKIFQYLEIRDWLNCAKVCCAWKSIVQSGTLWSQ
ncbi:hypothetical protein GOODEAATRI_024263, partial [Goodea atripinnis]